MTTIKQQLLTYLEEKPPCLSRTICELCGGQHLVTIANHDRYGLPVRFVMCRRCGLVVLNPRWDQEGYATFYTEYYRPLLVESGIRKSVNKWQERFEKMVQATDLNRILPPAPRVLDIGGGEGQLAGYLREQYQAEVVIVEPNAREAEQAAARGFEVYARGFEECQFEATSFDLVVLMRTVDHLIDASLTFKLCQRLLKPGGKVLLDGVDYFRRMAFRRDAVAPLKIDHCYYFSPETLPALLQRCGLQPLITDLVTVPGQIVVLAQVASEEPDETILTQGERRYHEWEQLANRPLPVTQSVPLARSMRTELNWLRSKVRSRLNGR